MKKAFVLSSLLLFAVSTLVGCRSGFGSCFTRNGSRVPTATIAETSETAVGPAIPTNEVVMMQATSATSTCDPCAPNACDPCGPSQSSATAAYPGAYSGM